MGMTSKAKSANLPEQLRDIVGLLPFLERHRGTVVRLIVARVAALACGIPLPLLTKRIVDQVILRRDWNELWSTAMLCALVCVLTFAVAVYVSFLNMKTDSLISCDLRRLVLKKWTRLPLKDFKRYDSGEHLYRVTTDVDNVKGLLIQIGPTMVVTAVELAVFSALALSLNVKVTIISAATWPLFVILAIVFARRVREFQANVQRCGADFQTLVSYYIDSVVTTKVLRCERFLAGRGVHFLIDIVRNTVRRWRIESTGQGLRWLLTTGWSWVVFFYGAAMVMRGEMTLGTLLAVRMYLTSLEKPLAELGSLIQSISLASVSARDLAELQQLPEEPITGAAQRPSRVQPETPLTVHFDDVHFGYEPSQPVLIGVNGRFGPAGLIGITGPSGAGKTTLISLLARLVEPCSGRILVDGEPIQDVPLSELRRWLSIMPQEAQLFPGTIAANIACGEREASSSEVEAAARMAHAHEFIKKLPSGYDTPVGTPAGGLSTGQKQRIGLARAFIRRSRLLVLDEGLRGLDPQTCRHVIASLKYLAERQTILMISHDPLVLSQCDEVAVLLDGSFSVRCQGADLRRSRSVTEYLKWQSLFDRTVLRGATGGSELPASDTAAARTSIVSSCVIEDMADARWLQEDLTE
jgi:ATP-binding cassette subfamily B protein